MANRARTIGSSWHTPVGRVVAIALVVATSFLDAVISPLGIPIDLLVIWDLLRAAGQ